VTNLFQPEAKDRVTVEISRDLEEIVPIFLGNRENDLSTLRNALTRHDFGTIETIGHRLKGDGGGYGFDRITEIGAAMEQAAKQRDHSMTDQQILQLEDFLRRVTIIYR
jgi:histidine phosphotransfer protein HptB